MAKHGENKKMKRLNTPNLVSISKKDNVWLSKPIPGTHPRSKSISLVVLLRDVLKLAGTSKEATTLVKGGKILVDGRIVRDHKFPIGYMDLITIPDINMTYYIDLDHNGRFVAKRDDKRKNKLLRLRNRKTLGKGKYQLTFSDGRTLLSNEVYKPGDSVIISMPDMKIVEHLPLKEGSNCRIIGGTRSGMFGKVKAIVPGSINSRAKIEVQDETGKIFFTVKEYVYVIKGGDV
jgi:small subunit ribosomal protein S4e